MQIIQTWLPIAIIPTLAVLQWGVMRNVERKRLAAAKARHREAEQSAAKLLQQTRKQIAQLQQELATVKLQAKRTARPAPPPPQPEPEVRDTLLAMLDDAPPRRHALPVDGFADTLPSLQFPHASML
ncbi:MAG TPA: hypothetical protein VGP22_09695 [Albitalea sp.]|jgi:hypothetical protein|nr:hypothetical protein [Albitalea sp.]